MLRPRNERMKMEFTVSYQMLLLLLFSNFLAIRADKNCSMIVTSKTNGTIKSFSLLSRSETIIMALITVVLVAALAQGFNLKRKHVFDDKVRTCFLNSFSLLLFFCKPFPSFSFSFFLFPFIFQIQHTLKIIIGQ